MADSEAGGGSAATVLIVDNEPKVTDLYAEYLSDAYDVRRAYGGQQALTAIDDDPDVDVVLLDRRMPDRTGDEVLTELRERGYDGRVVMVTGLNPDFDIVDMPFDDYVTKPATRDDLHTAIERQLVRDTYDSQVSEYLRIREKVDLLEEEKSSTELAEDDSYKMLSSLAESLRADIEDVLDEHGLPDPEDLRLE